MPASFETTSPPAPIKERASKHKTKRESTAPEKRIDRTQQAEQAAQAMGQEAVAEISERSEAILGKELADSPEAQQLIERQQEEVRARVEEALQEYKQASASEDAPTPTEIPPQRLERVAEMRQKMDAYIEQRKAQMVADQLAALDTHASPDERARIGLAVQQALEQTREFFTSVDAGKRANTPLERMAQVYEHLDEDGVEATPEFKQAVSAHMQEMMERAFDQHIDNPEQYVSHGFDHSLNVADYAKDIIDLNDTIVQAASEKYGLSAGEAKFLLENVALFHDCGYPHVGARAKAVHGIAGADLISSPKMQGIFNGIIRSREAKKDLLNHDLRDAILFHSADKVEKKFDAKIITTRGSFLAVAEGSRSDEIIDVLSTFHDPEQNADGLPRETVEIQVANETVQREIQEVLARAARDTERKTGSIPTEVRVTIKGEQFKGRFADLHKEKDNKLGLEYAEVDATQSPMHAIIRLADNMDMRNNRFSEVQREPAFREIYQALGNDQSLSKSFQWLEGLEKKSRTSSATPETAAALLQEAQQAMYASIQSGEIALLGITPERISSAKNLKELEGILKQATIDHVLSKPEHARLPKAQRERIAKIGMAQSAESMRHFGGCEAITSVKLEQRRIGNEERPCVVVRVRQTAEGTSPTFDELNRIRIVEKSLDAQGNTNSVEVGVGEYQVWRAEEAYRSIRVDGKPVEVMVFDEQNREVVTSYRRALAEAFEG